MSNDLLYLPTLKKDIVRPWFLPSKETLEAQKQLLSSIYFLVKQGDAFGERLRCKRCNGRHDYITLMCVERPFTGMMGGLYAYYRTITDNGLQQYLSPEEKARLQGIVDHLQNMPDLSVSHPQTSREITNGMGQTDLQLGAYSFGILEGIAAVHAAKLVQKINDRGLKPKLEL